MNKIIKKKYSTIITFILPLILILIGFLLHRDYGISLDEEITRMNGLVSIKYIYDFFFPHLTDNFELIKNVPDLKDYSDRQYGAFFEILLIFIIEILFEVKNFAEIFYYRHLANHLVFITSIIFFYFLCCSLFKNKIYSFFGAAILYTSPRIFAESFYNSKDLVFLSFFIFVIFFSIRFIKNTNYSNTFFLSIFAAIAVNLRIVAIYVGLLIALIFLIEFLMKNKASPKKIKNLIFFFIFQFIFIYIFWPFLWEKPIVNFIFALESFSRFINLGTYVFYLGDFHKVFYMPWHYFIVCFLATTPILIIILITLGLIQISLRLFRRLLSIEHNNSYKDIWRSEEEKVFLFLFFIVFVPIFAFFLFDSVFYNSWRHLFFLYPPLILISTYWIHTVAKKFRYKKISISINIFLIFLLCNNVYNLIKLHPFQYIYFNSFFEKKANKLFEIDYWGVSNKTALENIVKNNFEKNKIIVGVASFTNLYLSKKMLDKELQNKLIISGQDFSQADFIFNNNYFEINPKYDDKYLVPENYKKYIELKKGRVLINEFYKRK